ncbi:diacylglycerol/lipid kinase family protein [Aromatoleum sp.]|uniref:diacylglycerol/lipid kinase family protein n=1 Tax=Aromatoleum sp. TaxID=2307007 RepID=UPI002FC7FBA3
MNASSGSRYKPNERSVIENVLRQSGRDALVWTARHPRELPALAQLAAESRGGILAGAGGDGTLNAVASVARARGLPFGLIPLGTFNYFARQLGIPPDPAAAASNLVESAIRPVAIGDINGHLFLNNASIGLYRRLLERREIDKRRFGRSRAVAFLSGIAFLLREHRPYQLVLSIDKKEVKLSTLTVFFGRNALQMEQLGLDEALCVARGELAVLALRDVGRVELLRLALRGALADLETAENLRQGCASEVRVERSDGESRRLRVAIDGESVLCCLPLVVRSIPGGLQVVTPPVAGARA